jgi:hypothetical protein
MSSKQIAVNLLFTFVVCLSVSMSFAMLQQVRTLRQQLAVSETAAHLRDVEAREDIDTTYKILSGMASRWRLTSNMQVRSYHYISKHEGTHIGCPECFDILRRNGEAIPARTPDANHAE